MDQNVPWSKIRAVEKKGGVAGKGVDVQFIGADGGEKSVRLYLKDTDAFLAAIGKEGN